MSTTGNLNSGYSNIPFIKIFKAGFLTGTLDICCAFLYSYLKRGTTPEIILQSITKVVLRKQAFLNPFLSAGVGLLIHFIIAMVWTILFFILYPRFKPMRLNYIFTGIVYGTLVWTAMNMLILPAWSNKAFIFNPVNSLISALILIIAIGLPLSILAHTYYSKNKNIEL